jgi:hypothetical protein
MAVARQISRFRERRHLRPSVAVVAQRVDEALHLLSERQQLVVCHLLEARSDSVEVNSDIKFAAGPLCHGQPRGLVMYAPGMASARSILCFAVASWEEK